jgi:hypothetical protein
MTEWASRQGAHGSAARVPDLQATAGVRAPGGGRHPRGKALALVVAATLVLAGCGGSSRAVWTAGSAAPTASSGSDAADSPTPTATGPDAAQQQRFAAAAAMLTGRPGTIGIIVRDRRTGAIWRAGVTDHPTWTASTIKLALVTGLLERARRGEITLDAAAHQQIADILNFSSDAAATTLWNRYGKDAMVPAFQQVYGMTGLTFLPGFPRIWGHMKCTAEDLLHLMSYVLDRLDPTDRASIVDGMRHVGPIQRWGVYAAGPAQQPGTKDGWSIEPDAGAKHWVTNAVGFAGPDERYAVAVMYQLPPGPGIDVGVHAVSDLVATVFGAQTPAPVTVPDPSTGL